MKKYKVDVLESVIRKDFTIIEANSREEAEKIVRDMWVRGEFYFEPNQTEIVGEPELLYTDAEEVE